MGGWGPTEAIELVRGLANFFQRILESIRLGAVCAQKRFDDPLEETSPCAIGVQHAD